MWETLPPISIVLRSDRRNFLRDMGELAEASGRFTVEHHFDDPLDGGIYPEATNFRYLHPSIHEELGFQLLGYESHPSEVAVEIRANRWTPDPPTRAVYVEAARSLLSDVLSAYNHPFQGL
jgi:hypothetical protein